jgi:hypothetical protein
MEDNLNKNGGEMEDDLKKMENDLKKRRKKEDNLKK